MRNVKLQLKQHLADRLGSYLFVSVLFTVGVFSGAISVNQLSFSQRQELLGFLQQFFSAGAGIPASADAFLRTLVLNLQMAGAVWLMGIILFGLPIIVLLVFFRGFILGFSVGFLINQMGMKGLLFASCSVIPHNLISVPVGLAISAIAISFVMQTLKPPKSLTRQRPMRRIGYYTSTILALSILLIIASLVETYVTPAFVHLVSRVF